MNPFKIKHKQVVLAVRWSASQASCLDTSRVLLFVKSVDERDREQVGLLLETEDGLTAD